MASTNRNRTGELEQLARTKAKERISNLLQRPDQLEKVDEFKKREARKKTSTEAMLKTSLQYSLDGVRTALEHTKLARRSLIEVGSHTSELRLALKDVPSLGKALEGVREENLVHSQYAMAMENMNNIFNVSKNIEKAQTMISDGQLLQAHMLMAELESSRDELLFELFRMQNKSEHTMLLDYFADVSKLSESLEKTIIINLKRTLNMAATSPHLLVTTLRIIEREEIADAASLQRLELSGFKPPGRPKKWKAKALQVLEDSVSEKLDACQLDSRAINKMWLVRYLEVMRQLILQDLRVIKFLVVPCFKPSYNILSCYVDMYHRCLSNKLQECIAEGLEGFEFVSLLSWVLNTYTGPQLLRSTDLDLNPEIIPSNLLPKDVIDNLNKQYLKHISEVYRACRRRILEKEVEDWTKNTLTADADNHYSTEAPVNMFQMVDENLQVAKTVSQELVQEMLLLSLEVIREYGQAYLEEVRFFKEKYFEDRSKVQYFTHSMIAIINNCTICIDLAHQTKDRYWKSSLVGSNSQHNSKAIHQFDAVLEAFERLRNNTSQYLLDEAFLDLEPHFQEIATRTWLTSTVAVDTICVTLEDYFQDYVHLKPKNFDQVMSEAKTLVAKKYLLALLSRKIALKSQEERRAASKKITDEAALVKQLFDKVGSNPHVNKSECPFDSIRGIAEVINVDDLDILSLEISSFIKRYPDLSKEQLMAILSIRGDIGRFDLNKKASDVLQGNSVLQKVPQSIFSKVPIHPSLFS